MKRISIIAALALSTSLLAQQSVVMPYLAYTDYEDSMRDDAMMAGVYGYQDNGITRLEAALGYTYIDYKPDADRRYHKQLDATILGTYYHERNWAIKGGIHNIWSKSDQRGTNYDPVLKFGLVYYVYGQYNIEGDLYYSDYDDFNVYQLRLKYGEFFTIEEFPQNSFYFETAINQIHISESGYAPKDDYTNVDLRIDMFDRSWSLGLFASLGKAAYKVDKEGWIVYNLGEEYKYVLGMEYSYYLDRTTSLKIGLNRAKFNENVPEDSYANTLSLFYIKGF